MSDPRMRLDDLTRHRDQLVSDLAQMDRRPVPGRLRAQHERRRAHLQYLVALADARLERLAAPVAPSSEVPAGLVEGGASRVAGAESHRPGKCEDSTWASTSDGDPTLSALSSTPAAVPPVRAAGVDRGAEPRPVHARSG